MASRARVLAVGETNVGMKRSHNEDNFVVVDLTSGKSLVGLSSVR